MTSFQDGADAYGAYTQGSHIKGVQRRRYMGGGLAQMRRDQVRDGGSGSAFNANGLSTRPTQTTGTKGAAMAAEAAREAAAKRGAARAAEEMGAGKETPVKPLTPAPPPGSINDAGKDRAPTRPVNPNSKALVKYRRKQAMPDTDNDAGSEPDNDADDRPVAMGSPGLIRIG